MKIIYPQDITPSPDNLNAKQIWELFKQNKIEWAGIQPYYFRQSRVKGCICESVARWDDGWDLDDGTDYEDTKKDKADFIERFNEQYPHGVIPEWVKLVTE